MKTYNILIVGVGGQGVILASELLSEAALKEGFDVKKSEVHGMAQRGGVVSSHVRFGEKVYSPLIPDGESHVVLAFEAAEGLRVTKQVADNGLLVINDQTIVPTIAHTKGFSYPENPIEKARAEVNRVIAIDGVKTAQQIGNPKLVNVILLGAIAKELPIKKETWESVIRKRVPRGTEQANLAAFAEGMKHIKES